MYLDSATRTKVEETGGANFLFVTKDGKASAHFEHTTLVTEDGPEILTKLMEE